MVEIFSAELNVQKLWRLNHYWMIRKEKKGKGICVHLFKLTNKFSGFQCIARSFHLYLDFSECNCVSPTHVSILLHNMHMKRIVWLFRKSQFYYCSFRSCRQTFWCTSFEIVSSTHSNYFLTSMMRSLKCFWSKGERLLLDIKSYLLCGSKNYNKNK